MKVLQRAAVSRHAVVCVIFVSSSSRRRMQQQAAKLDSVHRVLQPDAPHGRGAHMRDLRRAAVLRPRCPCARVVPVRLLDLQSGHRECRPWAPVDLRQRNSPALVQPFSGPNEVHHGVAARIKHAVRLVDDVQVRKPALKLLCPERSKKGQHFSESQMYRRLYESCANVPKSRPHCPPLFPLLPLLQDMSNGRHMLSRFSGREWE
jgi:hypothetical protein